MRFQFILVDFLIFNKKMSFPYHIKEGRTKAISRSPHSCW
ncbi:hypothetical protein HMPREF9393_1109 [Streptococcus sanguinis SK1056]|uniref:Uncharacterized protein n=2 Tax=Streptococcus sanguinis TaxID=1305 RepID=F0I0A1_STRSA|nr:hypothetical protein HMPREF9381_0591 [Streptococcus sanguinis SK72]EGJ39487.1 hypothetical protein HMPREF9393_1109 [Streptococcus sanguinis SK1056]